MIDTRAEKAGAVRAPAAKTALLLAAVALATVVVAAVPSPAWAAPVAAAPSGKDRARVEFDKAQIQYKLGHFDQALEAYARAYELFPAPAFLFNIGQCHKNLKNHERAVFFFEGYLREEKDPAKRRLAEELAAESRAELDKQAAARAVAAARASAPVLVERVAPAPATPTPSVPAAAAPVTIAAPVLVAAPETTGGAEARVPARRSPWPWIGIGVALAAIAGGAIYWATGAPQVVPPSGSAGTLDLR